MQHLDEQGLFCFSFVGLDLTTASEHIVIDFQS